MSFARSEASDELKFPEICTVPLKFDDWNAGFDCTRPSSTIATSSVGDGRPNDWAASLLNCWRPSLVRSSSTTYWFWNRFFALLTCLPASAVGPRRRRYLSACGSCERNGSTTHASLVSSTRRVVGMRSSALIAVLSHEAIAARAAASADSFAGTVVVVVDGSPVVVVAPGTVVVVVGVTFSASGTRASTGRNRSSAVLPTIRRALSRLATPGRSTTMLLP